MLGQILDPAQDQLLKDERRLLSEIETALAGCELSDEDRKTLIQSITQLDELFLVVVVGEFNAGKSAFINALLGTAVLEEGVTPTTSKIHLVRFGEELTREPLGSGQELISAPVESLRHLNIVDTPGTNAIDRQHEAITADFVPRSDLVLFVTSADRPFSESERAFLERIRQWGKKVMVVVNKIDILRAAEEVEEIRSYVAEHGHTLLGLSPRIFTVSATSAAAARENGDQEALDASGLPAVEEALQSTLDETERVRLKLLNPLGVADHLLALVIDTVAGRLELLHDDIRTIDDIEAQLETYAEDVDREFGLRLSDMDNILHKLERRGAEFFDDTLRLLRLKKLFNKEQLRSDFETVVVADAPQQIESKVESMIDWLVESDLNQWQAVVQHVNRRRSLHAERMVGEVGGRFDLDRAVLLDTVGRAARDGVESYDRRAEARRMAEDVQKAVTGTALVEAGALGLGATVAFLATSSAADATGLVAAGLLAAVGLFILLDRRRRAKRDLKDKIAAMRSQLMTSVTEQFTNAAQKSRSKVRDTIAPYTRFVSAERKKLEGDRNQLEALQTKIDELRGRIENLAQ